MAFSLTRSLKRLCNCTNFLKGEFSINLNYNSYVHQTIVLLKQQVKHKNITFNCCRYMHHNPANNVFERIKVAPDDDTDLHEFNSSYEIIRKAVLHIDDKVLKDAVNWSVKVLDYNAQGGKKNRGVTVLKAYKILSEGNTSSEGRLQACILGWCVEMLQAFLLVLDDIMDNSPMRRGKPCWYKKPDVGLTAVNDSLLLECSIYKILEIYFSNADTYSNLLHEFLQTTRNTIYGQSLDMLNVPPDQKPRFENFNMEKYEAIVKYKTSHYSFCLPVHLAMHHIGNFSAEDFKATQNICFKLGLLFQIQDDYIDVFGNPDVTGKLGSDISEGKCTWFAVTVFEHAPDAMKKIMVENYGINDEVCISKVMKLYEDLGMKEKFYKCEEALVQDITSLMNTLSKSSLQRLFHSLLQKLYKRRK